MKDFLRKLENEPLLTQWRQSDRAGRKQLATNEGLSEDDAEAVASGDFKKVRQAVKKDSPGAEVLYVVMVE